MKPKSLNIAFVVMILVVTGFVACSRSRSDADIINDVQARIHANAQLAATPITVQANSGVVVLSGTVANEADRALVEGAAKQAEGVKSVINNIQIVTAATPPAAEPPSMESHAAATPSAKPVPAKSRPTANVAAASKAVVPSESKTSIKPTPELAKITIPEGTPVIVRLIDPVDTAMHKEGDRFRASLDSPIVIDDKTVVPKNADVEVSLVSAKSAGKFTGSSSVVLVVTKMTVAGKTYELQTGEFTKQGASRGKRSAIVIGGGTAAGALIGGLAGGGKGAAIGAAAGAGAGTGIQALTKSQQIQLPSETVLEFQLKTPVTVTPATETVKREKIG